MLIQPRKVDHEQIRKDAFAKTRCLHQRKELRRRILSNGSVAMCEQCLNCGNNVGQSISQKKIPAVELERLKEWDHELHPAYLKKSDDVIFGAIEEAEAKASAEWHRDYEAYLQSPEWKTRRARVMKRANHICEGCLTAKASVVHHLTYAHAGDELMFELVALCDPCHRKCHPDETPHPKQDD